MQTAAIMMTLCLFVTAINAMAVSNTTTELSLWHDKPALKWVQEALPIGNGRLGAMMFGGVENERIQFNEQTLWVGEGGTFEYPHIGPVGRSTRTTLPNWQRRP